MAPRALRVGVAGLGRALTVMLPTFVQDPRVRLVAAADPFEPARARFGPDFGGPALPTVEQLCALPDVDVVDVAMPHGLHADRVCLAAAHGKHVLVEKPVAIRLEDSTRMIEAARAAGVHLLVGPSHSYDAPIPRTRDLMDGGRFGEVRMITAQDHTDFLHRPRRPEELRTAMGGAVVHSQAAHRVDVPGRTDRSA